MRWIAVRCYSKCAWNAGIVHTSRGNETKILLLGSIFPEKIEYDGKNYRTNSYNKLLDVIYQETNHLRGGKEKTPLKNQESPLWGA